MRGHSCSLSLISSLICCRSMRMAVSRSPDAILDKSKQPVGAAERCWQWEKKQKREGSKNVMTGRSAIWFPPRHSHVHLMPQLPQRQHRRQTATARTAIKTSLSSTSPRYRAVSCTNVHIRTHARTHAHTRAHRASPNHSLKLSKLAFPQHTPFRRSASRCGSAHLGPLLKQPPHS